MEAYTEQSGCGIIRTTPKTTVRVVYMLTNGCYQYPSLDASLLTLQPTTMYHTDHHSVGAVQRPEVTNFINPRTGNNPRVGCILQPENRYCCLHIAYTRARRVQTHDIRGSIDHGRYAVHPQNVVIRNIVLHGLQLKTSCHWQNVTRSWPLRGWEDEHELSEAYQTLQLFGSEASVRRMR